MKKKLASILNDYLRQARFEPHSLANGLEVVPWVREQSPDLILLDLMLSWTGWAGNMQGNPLFFVGYQS